MKKNEKDTQESSVSNYYDLKTDAVEALVNADSEEAPEYTEEELNKYRKHKGFHIPEAVKILFIKAWFAGAVCFFLIWGLGLSAPLDILVIVGTVLGMVTDLLTNNVIRFFESTPGENDTWLMVTRKGVLGMFLNIFYSFLIMFCVYMLYNAINLIFVAATGNADKIYLGVEPILFGVFCMGFDMLFIGIKRMIGNIIRSAKGK